MDEQPMTAQIDADPDALPRQPGRTPQRPHGDDGKRDPDESPHVLVLEGGIQHGPRKERTGGHTYACPSDFGPVHDAEAYGPARGAV